MYLAIAIFFPNRGEWSETYSFLECYPSEFKTLSEPCFLLLLRLPRSRPAYSARTWTWSFSTASVKSFLQGAYIVCQFPLKGRFDHQSWPLHEMFSLSPNECTDNGAIHADVVVYESIMIDTSKLKTFKAPSTLRGWKTLKSYFKHKRQCFIRISKHREKSWKYNAQRNIFDEIRDVWIADETLSLVFDISSRSKQKLRSKQRSKIVKICAN